MLWTHEAEVLVVGAGPVGLMSALMLAERGIAVEVIDEEQGPGQHNYALTLHPSSLKLLDDVGLGAGLLGEGVRVDTVALYDGQRHRASIRLDQLDAEFPFLLVLPRNALAAALEARLKEKKIKIHWGHRLANLTMAGDHVAATVEKLGLDSGGYPIASSVFVVEKERVWKPRYLIGADGFHSAVRRRLHIPFDATSTPLSFAAVEIEGAAERPGEARVVLGQDSTDVLWPLPSGRRRWSLQLHGQDEPNPNSPFVPFGQRTYPAVPDARVKSILQERAPWFEADPKVAWAAEVRFEPSLARRFGQGRVWLAGDAAHVTGPVGVQSLNAGLHEAHDLASRLARLLRSDGTEGLLEHYHDEWSAAWRQLMGLAAAPVLGAGSDTWVGENASRLLSCIPGLGEHLRRLGQQLGLEIPLPGPRG